MRSRIAKLFPLALLPLVGITILIPIGRAQKPNTAFTPTIPKTWDDATLVSLQVPLADTNASPKHIPADYYYRMPVRLIYKSYPIYAPGKEPPGYIENLKKLEPEIVFDPAKLKTEADWIKAGELVFEAPIAYDYTGGVQLSDVRNRAWYQHSGVLTAKDGVMPYTRYVFRKKGVVEVGGLACLMCHTRVMSDGSVIKGAQGNFSFDHVIGWNLRTAPQPEEQRLESQRVFDRFLYAVPWLRPDPLAQVLQLPLAGLIAVHESIPLGVNARHGTNPLSPAQVPDLIGVKERRYLDHTGLVRHRNIGDLMRYAALNQDADLLARYGDFRPVEVFGKMPEPKMGGR